MRAFLFYGYEFLSSFLPLLIGILVYARIHPGISRKRIFGLLLFSVYFFGVYHVTGIGTIYDILRNHLQLQPERINWIPFSKVIWLMGYVLNVIMFVPLGMCVPALWRSLDRFSAVAGLGFGLSLLIELSQLLNHRSTDIDDLIMNTIGAIIGYAIYMMTVRHKKSAAAAPLSPALLLLCILLPLLGRFLFYNEMGAARLLYGF